MIDQNRPGPHPSAWEYRQQPYAQPQQPQPQTIYIGDNRKKTNHLLHLILTLLTVGLWLPVWIIVAIVNN